MATENGVKYYRLSAVAGLDPARKSAYKSPPTDKDAHWLKDLLMAGLNASLELEDFFIMIQDYAGRLKKIAEEDSAHREMVEADLNTEGEIYGKPVGELLFFGPFGGKKKLGREVLDLWIRFNNIQQALLDVDLTLNVTGLFNTEVGRQLKHAAMQNRTEKSRSRFPVAGRIVQSGLDGDHSQD